MQYGRITLCLILISCAIGIVCTLLCLNKIKGKDGTVTDTVTQVVYDTTFIDSPVPKDSIVVRYITRIVPVHQDTAAPLPIIIHDSIPITIPITQKIYEDSTYKAWISGYEPNLDSIRIYHKTITKTITKKETKKTGIGIQAGIGITPRGVQPYAGVGFSLNF